jgi:hypothetical protein
MNNKIFRSLFCYAAIPALFLTGCNDDPKVTPIDESAYLGTFIGKHYLADSASLRLLVGQDENMIYDDTLTITTGASTSDGIVSAQSTLLSGRSLEVNLADNTMPPKLLGDLTILSTTLKDVKVNTGSTASWGTNNASVTTHLAATVTYLFNGSPIEKLPVTINGSFVKQ